MSMIESYTTCMYVRVTVVGVSFRVTAAMPSQRHIRARSRHGASECACRPRMHVSTSMIEYR